jgi:hypothetical protein
MDNLFFWFLALLVYSVLGRGVYFSLSALSLEHDFGSMNKYKYLTIIFWPALLFYIGCA